MAYTIEELEAREDTPIAPAIGTYEPKLLMPAPNVMETDGGVIITDMLGKRRFYPRPDFHLGGVR